MELIKKTFSVGITAINDTAEFIFGKKNYLITNALSLGKPIPATISNELPILEAQEFR